MKISDGKGLIVGVDRMMSMYPGVPFMAARKAYQPLFDELGRLYFKTGRTIRNSTDKQIGIDTIADLYSPAQWKSAAAIIGAGDDLVRAGRTFVPWCSLTIRLKRAFRKPNLFSNARTFALCRWFGVPWMYKGFLKQLADVPEWRLSKDESFDIWDGRGEIGGKGYAKFLDDVGYSFTSYCGGVTVNWSPNWEESMGADAVGPKGELHSRKVRNTWNAKLWVFKCARKNGLAWSACKNIRDSEEDPDDPKFDELFKRVYKQHRSSMKAYKSHIREFCNSLRHGTFGVSEVTTSHIHIIRLEFDCGDLVRCVTDGTGELLEVEPLNDNEQV